METMEVCPVCDWWEKGSHHPQCTSKQVRVDEDVISDEDEIYAYEHILKLSEALDMSSEDRRNALTSEQLTILEEWDIHIDPIDDLEEDQP